MKIQVEVAGKADSISVLAIVAKTSRARKGKRNQNSGGGGRYSD
jgi:hypothetical protein